MENRKNRLLSYGHTVLKLASLIAVLTLLGLFFLLIRQISSSNLWAKRVNHAAQVRKEITQALVNVKDAEARQRGFLLTNDSSFLTWNATRQELREHLANLRSLVESDPHQQRNADSIVVLINQRLQLLDAGLALHSQTPSGDAALKKILLRGKSLSEDIERRLQRMDNFQAQLLEERTVANAQSVAATPRLAGLLVLAALLIILFAFYRQRLLLSLSRTYLKKNIDAVAEVRRTSLLLEHAEQLNNAGSWEWNYVTQSFVLSANMHRLLHGNNDNKTLQASDMLSWLGESDRTEFLQIINRCIANSEEQFTVRFWINCSGGDRKYFQCNGRIGKNKNNETVITGTARDVTEEALLKQQLQQRKELIESIVENTSDLIAVVDTDLRYTVWNKANEQQFGRSKKEVLGRRITDVFPFLKEDVRFNYMKEGLQGKATYLKELPYLNGEKTAEFSYVPLTDSHNKVVGLLIMAHDITERKRAAEDLQKANAELKEKNEDLIKALAFNRLVSGLVPTNIVVFDTMQQIPVFLNKQARAMYGGIVENAAATKRNVPQSIIHPDDLPTELEKVRNLQNASDTDVVESDCRFRNQSGEYRQMHVWRAVFKRSKNGDVEQIISVSLDVTDLRKAENELKERNRELLHANEELSSFNYIASHDMQEPLRKVQVFANLLQENETALSPQSASYLYKIQTAASRMRNLISDLLSYSQINQREAVWQPVDLNDVLASTLLSLKVDIDEKAASITATKLPVICGTRFQWQQLFENILSNALKYSKPDVPPVVSISATQTLPEADGENGLETAHEYFQLRFADNGIGFKPEYADKIFEMFERLHDRQEYPGTGLGLAICKKIVQNHKGFIRATGRPNEGTVIEVYVPVTNQLQPVEVI